MELIIRMKTVFFEKTPYRLEATQRGLLLILVKADGPERMLLLREDILSVSLTERRYPELEIQTRRAVYSGILEDGYPFSEMASYLSENLKLNITCEYKGGA